MKRKTENKIRFFTTITTPSSCDPPPTRAAQTFQQAVRTCCQHLQPWPADESHAAWPSAANRSVPQAHTRCWRQALTGTQTSDPLRWTCHPQGTCGRLPVKHSLHRTLYECVARQVRHWYRSDETSGAWACAAENQIRSSWDRLVPTSGHQVQSPRGAECTSSPTRARQGPARYQRACKAAPLPQAGPCQWGKAVAVAVAVKMKMKMKMKMTMTMMPPCCQSSGECPGCHRCMTWLSVTDADMACCPCHQPTWPQGGGSQARGCPRQTGCCNAQAPSAPFRKSGSQRAQSARACQWWPQMSCCVE